VPEGTPPAEILVDSALVRRLIGRQAPAWSSHAIEPFQIGWDNAMFRLGDQHLVRMPRRQSADALLRHEQRILPFLQARLNTPIPTPVIIGKPDADFPWHWSVLPFFPATTANQSPLDQRGAMQWAEFMASLHRPYLEGVDPAAPANPFRGVDINSRRSSLEERVTQLHRLNEPVPNALLDTWQTALAQPPSSLRVWLHGDPHSRNVLSRSGSLAAVIDWGDITTGDPASDLGSFWMLIHDRIVRTESIARYLAMIRFSLTPAESSALLLRARGWAVLYGAMLLATGLVDHPEHAAMGRATFRNLLEQDQD
jgi:aminoglycoside phosphotransferase (APT) family kinase protein